MALCAAISCATSRTGVPPSQEARREVVLALSASSRLLDSDRTVTFEQIEDSRCPTGVTCVWAGDAIVGLRVDGRGDTARHSLSLNQEARREAVVGDIRVTLVSVTPHPSADRTPRPDEYRITLSIERP